MTKHDQILDKQFTALGDPTRRAILTRLARSDATVSELAAPHGLSMPTFLAHLSKLETAGLIHSTKEGRVRTCRLSENGFTPARVWLDDQRALWEHRLDQFDEYITKTQKNRKNAT